MQWWRSNPDQGKTFDGSYNTIIVGPNDWALQKGTITFHIGDLQAEETAIYDGMRFQIPDEMILDLTFLEPPLDG